MILERRRAGKGVIRGRWRQPGWRWGLGMLAGCVWCACTAEGVPVRLHPVEASAADPDYPLAAAVDGLNAADNGWGVSTGVSTEQYAVFATGKPLDVAMCQFQFWFQSGVVDAHFGEFEIDVTTDEHPTVRGRWMPLLPEQAVANCLDGVRITGPVIRLETACPVSHVTVRAQVPFGGITGFRLKLFAVARDSARRNVPTIGCSAVGGFVLTELGAETEPQRSSNIALGRHVYCFQGVAPGLPSRHLTDGFYSSYSLPDPDSGGPAAFFELDLGRMTALDHITLRGRETGTDADRLAAYSVELVTESGGFPAEVQWKSRVRLADAPLPLGGADVIRESDGEGVFQGRRILIHNQSGQSRQPQIAEVEVYPALLPRVRDWLADGRFLPPGEEVAVPAGTETLQFSLECGHFPELADTVVYRWRMPGWRDSWEETGPHGRVTLAPLPRTGTVQLDLEARHSDGVWDQSGQPIVLRIMEPWWRNPLVVSVVLAVTLVFAAAVWWRGKAAVMKRRLARAEAHLDLHQERLRIARDMHDDMGARLTHIALLADRTRREANRNPAGQMPLLAELAEGARAAVSALDAIVWAVNPQHDSVGDFADYLSDYVPGYLQAASVECRLDLRVTAPRRSLGLTLRHSLLMAVKEALQNVVRHAGATVVHLKLSDAQGRLVVSVVDDGCGLKDAASGVTHSGLNNMRQRLSEAGGLCEIQTGENGRGTHVKFTVPLRPAA